jgi:aspartyl-tRNA(Asn)/glutamyl-tRNA(Gln) amidotransferase subunit C
MSLDKATVARVATLARIRVADADLAPLAAELSKILDWIAELDEVDTAQIEPMARVVKMKLPMRDDVVTDGGRRDDILRNAPQATEQFFAVPKVVE